MACFLHLHRQRRAHTFDTEVSKVTDSLSRPADEITVLKLACECHEANGRAAQTPLVKGILGCLKLELAGFRCGSTGELRFRSEIERGRHGRVTEVSE